MGSVKHVKVHFQNKLVLMIVIREDKIAAMRWYKREKLESEFKTYKILESMNER